MSSDYLNYSENLAFPPQQKTQAAVIKVFNCGEAAVAKSNHELTLEKKLAIAIEGINSAAAFLACEDGGYKPCEFVEFQKAYRKNPERMLFKIKNVSVINGKDTDLHIDEYVYDIELGERVR